VTLTRQPVFLAWPFVAASLIFGLFAWWLYDDNRAERSLLNAVVAAIFLSATLYGAVLANMVLLPLAAKLDRNNHAEALVANLTIMAAISIATHDSPRRLEVMLNSILPPAERIVYFD